MDGQSYLLLIRDEGGPPELQVGDPYPPRSLPTPSCGGIGGLLGRDLPGCLLGAGLWGDMRTARPEEGLPLWSLLTPGLPAVPGTCAAGPGACAGLSPAAAPASRPCGCP